MTINNQNYNVPSQVRSLLLSVVPYGSEYVLYTSSYSQGSQVYDLWFKKPAQVSLNHYQVTHVSGSSNSYTLSEVSTDLTYDGFSVSEPYYAYSSIPGQGIFEKLPSTDNMMCLMLIICASLAILRTVFGGIRLWSSKRKFLQ
jgi:hypothetical protein